VETRGVGCYPTLFAEFYGVFCAGGGDDSCAEELGVEPLGFVDADLEFVVAHDFLPAECEARGAPCASGEALHLVKCEFLVFGQFARFACFCGPQIERISHGDEFVIYVAGDAFAESRLYFHGMHWVIDSGEEFIPIAKENGE
jgi:hypothetical protein